MTGTGSETVTGGDRETLLTGYGGRLLLTISLGWATIQAGRLVLSPLLPTVIDRLTITPFEAGVALSVLWGLYALLQFPSGRLSDRLSRKTLLASGLSLLLVGFGVLSTAVSYPLFLFGAAVVGVGAGLYPTAARALVSDHFVERRGEAFGLHTASGDAGGAAAAGLAVAALALWTWRSAFVVVLAVLVVVLVVLHRLSREPYELRRVPLDVRGTGGRLVRNRRVRWLVVAYCLFAFTWQGATGFLPTLLQAEKGLSPALASAGFGALFAVGAVVKPLAGSLGDRTRRAPVAAAVLAVGGVALAGLLVAGSTVGVLAATVAFAAGLMGFPPVMQSYLMDVFPAETMGADLGVARTVYIGVGSLGPTYVGFVAGRLGYGAAFLGLVGCLVVASAIVAWQAVRGE